MVHLQSNRPQHVRKPRSQALPFLLILPHRLDLRWAQQIFDSARQPSTALALALEQRLDDFQPEPPVRKHRDRNDAVGRARSLGVRFDLRYALGRVFRLEPPPLEGLLLARFRVLLLLLPCVSLLGLGCTVTVAVGTGLGAVPAVALANKPADVVPVEVVEEAASNGRVR